MKPRGYTGSAQDGFVVPMSVGGYSGMTIAVDLHAASAECGVNSEQSLEASMYSSKQRMWISRTPGNVAVVGLAYGSP